MSDNSQENYINFYDNGKWTKIPNPLPDEPDFGKALEKAGFHQFDQVGVECGTRIEVHIGTDGIFFVVIDTATHWHPLIAADFPSLISLVNQLEPWVRMGMDSRKLEVLEEFAELLTEYGDDGPLGECLGNRRAYYARSKQERLERERKEKNTAKDSSEFFKKVSNWQAGFSLYVYRLEPITTRLPAEPKFAECYQEPVNEARILNDHGSGRYKMILRRIREDDYIGYLGILNRNHPPKIPAGDWINDPRNERWDWSKPPVNIRNLDGDRLTE